MAWLEPAAALALTALVALVPFGFARRWGWLHALAAGAIAYPAATQLVSFIDLAPLIGRPTVLQPYPIELLDRLPLRILRRNLLVPLAGLALVALLGGWSVTRHRLASLLKGPATWARELWLGLPIGALFIGAQAVALLLLAGPASALQTGDESALFANARWYHVVGLSLAPALAEELYYRGLLQGLLVRLLPGGPVAWAALVGQAVVFAVAHAGFTTLSHLLGPLLFGLGMGYVRATVGLGACIVTHASINLAYFSVDPGAGSVGLQVAALALTLAGLGVLAREYRALWAVLREGPEVDVGEREAVPTGASPTGP